MDSTLLNELRQAGPWLVGSWIVAGIMGVLWVVAVNALRAERIRARLQDESRISQVADLTTALAHRGADMTGHIGVLYYQNSTITDNTGARQSAGDVARQWAKEMLTNPGIICLPRDVFHYETHPLPGRIECKAAPLNEVEKRVDRSLDIHESRMSRLDDGLKAQAEALVSVRADLEKHKGIYAKIIEFNSRRDATITKILEGCADHALRLGSIEDHLKIHRENRAVKAFDVRFSGWPKPPKCGELPEGIVCQNPQSNDDYLPKTGRQP